MTSTAFPSGTMETAETNVLFSLSVRTVNITSDALKHSVKKITDESQGILNTVRAVSDVFNVIIGPIGPSSISEALGGIGLIAFPIPLAMKAITATVSKYVEQRTGFSLQSWTDFANSAKTQFEEYLAQISVVADLSPHLHHVSAAVKTENELKELQDWEQLLRDIKLKTKLWRPVMVQVSQLSRVVDSMLATRKESEQNAKSANTEEGWMRGLKYVTTTVEDAWKGVTNESQQLLERILAPISDLKVRTAQLNNQICNLSNNLWELEDLLDLEIAQIRTCLGKIPAQEVEILSKRVAASIVIPRLKKLLADAHQSVIAFQDLLEKVNQMHQQAKIKDKVYEILVAEFDAELHAAMTRENTLKAKANTWRNKQGPIFDRGINWLEDEIENVMARELVGQLSSDDAQERVAPLKRELNRFLDAKQFLVTL